MHEGPGVGVEDVDVGLLGEPVRRPVRGEQLRERHQTLAGEPEVLRQGAADVQLLVAHDRVAHHRRHAAGIPLRQPARERVREHRAHVAPVRALVRVLADLVRLQDVGPDGDEVLVAAGGAEAHGPELLAFPVLGTERLERRLVPGRDDDERPAGVDLGPRPDLQEGGPDLLELPGRPASRLLARVRHDGEVRALDLEPRGRRGHSGRGRGEDNAGKRGAANGHRL